MVNRGRSGACATCKQRRVKCDEATPECRACQRLGLQCAGYHQPSKYARLKFVSQNEHFEQQTESVVGGASRSPEADMDIQVLEVASPRLLQPDTAVSFYLCHYASMGRDLGSTRGFFEMLIPAYSSQPVDSPLSLAVSTLAAETLSLWRQDSSSFRYPRESYSRAITRLRTATLDPVERLKPATVLAVLTLQTYENACAVYGLRRASSTHHNGAASLLSLMNSAVMDGTVRCYLRKFMLHTEVSTAMRQKEPLESIAYCWMAGKDAMAAPDNPSAALDAIGVTVAELQASYTQFVAGGGSTMVLDEWRAEAKRVDAELLSWADSVPDAWRPRTLVSGRDIDPSIPTFQSVCEVYPSCQIASVWNSWRFQRLLLAKITLEPSSNSNIDPLDLVDRWKTLQEVVDGLCYSIPFHLGNRASRSSLTEFTDPTILLPGQYCHDIDAGMSKDDHRRHVIAQGPWRVMHPLSRFMTLFSEDHGEVIASFLRPGQRDWIRDQFLRVAKLLHLPGNDMEGPGSRGESADAKARHLARDIRKGAILMSGP